MNDLQQTPALSPPSSSPRSPLPPASFCNSNGGLANNHSNLVNMTNSSTCFSPSPVSTPSLLPSSTYPWGTWEDLLLASAVLKHGIDNWHTVSCELQARAFLVPPSLFSAEACKGRFWILNGRFSSCSNGSIRDGKIPWFEEVRKLRVAQLRRELELYDGSIGLLEKKLNRLKAERGGIETKTSNDTRELQSPSGVASGEVEGCLQVSSAGDQLPAQISPRIPLAEMLATDTVKASSTTASLVSAGDGGLDATVLVNALQESSAVESASCNVLSGGPVVEGLLNQHPTTIIGCQNSDSVNELTPIEVQHETLESQVCPDSILEVNKSCCDAEDKCHIQNDALPSIAARKSFEPPTSVIGAQGKYVPVTGAVDNVPGSEAFQHDTLEMEKCTDRYEQLEDGGLAVKDAVTRNTVSSDSLAEIESSGEVEVRGFAVEGTGPPYFPGQIESLANINFTQMESSRGQELTASESATAQTGNVLKDDDHIDNPLMSASAMDLLRIAYADGTPVSTPEAAEAPPVEEELNGAKETDSSCPSLDYQSVVHEAHLIGSSALEMPCEGTVKELDKELEATEQNQVVEIQTTVCEVSSPKELISGKAGMSDLASALEPEHLSESKVCSVEGLAETNTVFPKVTEVANIKMGILAGQADTELSQEMKLTPHSQLDLDTEVSDSSKGKLSDLLGAHEDIVKQEVQDLRVGRFAGNLECCRNLVENSNHSSNDRACLEMVEAKCEESYEECREQEASPKIFLANLDLSDEHPARTDKGVDNARKVGISGGQSLVEPKIRPGTPMVSSSEISGLASVEHPPAVYGGLCEADSQVQKGSPCNSDGRSSVVEAVSLSVNKHQKSDPEGAGSTSLFQADNACLELSRHKGEGKMPEMVSESMTIQRHAKPEEHSAQMPGSKLASNPELSSPRLKTEDSVDVDLLEEDGLLVDLMKLKGTDLTNLKKRKHLPKGGSNVDPTKDYGALRERLDEIVPHKQLKLQRFQGEDRKVWSADALQNMNSGSSKKSKLEVLGLDSSGEYLNQAALSSNVSVGESQDKSRSKESAIEVFSTRRSRLKLRKVESASKESDKVIQFKDERDKKSEDMAKDGSVQKSEDMSLDVGDEDSSRLEVSGLASPDGKPVTRLESTDSRLLPDLVILLECLRSISGHRFAPLFKLRPEIQGDAKYRVLIKKHMDLNTVRNQLEEGTYSSSLEFFRDMMLIFSNALVFYSRESQEYGAARVLRESLIREMERYLKKARMHGRAAATQTVKGNEMKVLKDVNMSNSVTTSDGKRQGFAMKSSCDHTNCETDLDVEVDTNGLTLATRLSAKDSGLQTSKCVIDLNWKKKDRGVKVPNKSLSRVKTTRTKTSEIEDERLNTIPGTKERVPREKHPRILEDGNTKLSIKKESPPASQASKRPYQISSKASRDYTPKRERQMSDKSRNSKYSSGRQVSVSQGRQGESRKSLVGVGRSSRSAQQSKQAYSRGNHSLSQPQKRAKI